MLTLTVEQRAVLEHVVVDADAWLTHAIDAFGERRAEEALKAKVAKWKPEYDAEVAKPAYKNRVQREVAESARDTARRSK